MSNLETKEIPFYDDTLLGVRDEEGVIWLAVKRACLGIGLSSKQADKQVANVQKSLLFKGNHFKLEVVQNEGSRKVKRESRKYFSNLWINFKDTFVCASYKDLNPKYFGRALEFVDGWVYKER